MNTALITQLRILKMSRTKPNYAELARMYDLDWRKAIPDMRQSLACRLRLTGKRTFKFILTFTVQGFFN
ncbi:MAG: hypothetical protein Q4D21_04390 [Phascolarctobacterium sp.]|nr:hypothetical protein [Phascolarctobacterium sp.]